MRSLRDVWRITVRRQYRKTTRPGVQLDRCEIIQVDPVYLDDGRIGLLMKARLPDGRVVQVGGSGHLYVALPSDEVAAKGRGVAEHLDLNSLVIEMVNAGPATFQQSGPFRQSGPHAPAAVRIPLAGRPRRQQQQPPQRRRTAAQQPATRQTVARQGANRQQSPPAQRRQQQPAAAPAARRRGAA